MARTPLAALMLAAALMLPACASAQPVPATTAQTAPDPAKPRIAVTKHSGRFNGQQLRYTATVTEHFVANDAGAPQATVTTIAYVRDGVRDPGSRPVMFMFNGGPGASSSPLHMQAMGPMIREGGGRNAPPAWKINTQSPIDVADLVFIDPVGTGFSRLLPGADGKPYFNVEGDAKTVKAVIAKWLKENGREASPRYLAGESYGTTRAAVIAKDSADLKWNGVMLVAVVPEVQGREMPFVVTLPTMAAGAWHHQKIDRAGRTVEQHFNAARDFARTDYVAALIKGASLPAAEKRAVAEQMSKFIGLPADFIEQKNLRLSKNDWMFNILKEKTLRTGLLDVQVTGPLEPGQDGAIDDPALGVVPPRGANAAPGSAPPTPAQVGAVESPVVAAYLRQVLKYPGAEPYYGVNFLVNSQWERGGVRGAMEGLAEAMTADPKLRLYWSGGYYDLTTPAYAAEYTFDQLGMPADRVAAGLFAGPHGVYEGEENLARFNQSVRDFVAGGK